MQTAGHSKKIFEAISAGNAEEAAHLLLKWLAAELPTSELLGQVGLIRQDLLDKLNSTQSEEEKQRIRTHFSAKMLDVLEQIEKSPEPLRGIPANPANWMPKLLFGLLILAVLLILIEILTW